MGRDFMELLMWEGTSEDHLLFTPCSKQDQLKQVFQGTVQLGFEYRSEAKSTTPSSLATKKNQRTNLKTTQPKEKNLPKKKKNTDDIFLLWCCFGARMGFFPSSIS